MVGGGRKRSMDGWVGCLERMHAHTTRGKQRLASCMTLSEAHIRRDVRCTDSTVPPTTMPALTKRRRPHAILPLPSLPPSFLPTYVRPSMRASLEAGMV